MTRFSLAALAILVTVLAGTADTWAATISPGGSGTFGTVNYLSGNVSLTGTASQSSTGFGAPASRAIDNNTNGAFGSNSTTHTNDASAGNTFWRVDFDVSGGEIALGSVSIFNRTDCCQSRLAVFDIELDNAATGSTVVLPQSVNPPAANNNFVNGIPGSANFPLPNNSVTTGLQVTQQANFFLSLAEVQAFGDPSLELSGDTLQIDISDMGADFVDVEGDATLDGTLEISNSGAEIGSTIDILTAADIDASNLLLAGDADNIKFQIVPGGNGQILQLVVTPEPTSIAIWGLGALALCFVGWRMRSRSN